ncbi:MAG: YD repeat-containing protein, partial [Muribaculaceae bacterium]|nr:YD repeat-containing protein [Muribaculaceae bacterium]
MTRRFSALVLITFFLTASAQDYITPVRTDLIPPSPQSTAVVEQQMPRPSLLTGAVDFSLPVYTIEADGYSLPISLRYHTNGIKVYDDHGVLGYGWTLQPALRVTRTIMGRPDELYKNVADSLNDASRTDRWQLAYRSIATQPRRCDPTDSQPDIFTIALPDRTLTRVTKADDGRVEFIGCGDEEYCVEGNEYLNSIIVIAPDGVRYIFGDGNVWQGDYYEKVENPCDTKAHIVSWMLHRIILPSGRAITFEWDEGWSFSYAYNGMMVGIDPLQSGLQDYELKQQFDNHRSRWSVVRGYQSPKVLKSVSFTNKRLDFTYNMDGLRCRSIASVTLSSTEDAKNKLRKAAMKYHDFGDAYLLSEVCLDGTGTYTFEYDLQREYVPADGGYSVDYWGYYNGASNSSLCPNIRIERVFSPGGGTDLWHFGRFNDRMPNSSAMQAGILKRINYPGGGCASFVYEPHTFKARKENSNGIIAGDTDPELSFGGGLRVKEISLQSSIDEDEPQIVRYSYSEPVVRAVPSSATFVSVCKGYTAIGEGRPEAGLFMIQPSSDYMRYDFGEEPIWYPLVKEHFRVGQIDYHFEDTKAPHNALSLEFGKRYIIELSRVGSNGPRLSKKVIYKTEGIQTKPVEEERYSYEILKSEKRLYGVQVCRDYVQFGTSGAEAPDFEEGHIIFGFASLLDPKNPDNKPTPYSLHPYEIKLHTERLVKTTKVSCLDNGNILQSDSVVYLSPETGIPSRAVNTHPHGLKTTDLVYPAPVSEMAEAHILNRPVEVIESTQRAVRHVKAEYQGKDGNFRPERIISWYDGCSDSIISPAYIHDRYGNLIQTDDADGVCCSYLYGHRNSLPCFKIEGMPRKALDAPADVLDGDAEKWIAENQGHALITAMEYSPFGNPAAITTPWAATTRYAYDNRGRLASIAVDGHGTSEVFSYSDGGADGLTVTSERFRDASGLFKHLKSRTYDGLGRLSVIADHSARGTDGKKTSTGLYIHHRYNLLGQLSGITGALPNADAPTNRHMWKVNLYEASPRGLPIGEIKQGAEWYEGKKSVEISRLTNSRTIWLSCPDLRIAPDGSISNKGRLPEQTIILETVCDEDGIELTIGRDLEGKQILRRNAIEKDGIFVRNVDAHYIYDDRGHLRYILPPNLGAKDYAADDPELLEHAYIYRYDDRDRLVWSKTPGAGPSQFAYTPAGRLVAEHSALLPAGSWRLHLYDRLGREVLTGTASLTDADIEALSAKAYPLDFPTGELPKLYDISTVPGSATFVAEHVTVYDKYPYYSDVFEPGTTAGSVRLDSPSGLKTFEVDVHSDGDYHTVTHHYSKLGQLIQSIESGSRHSLTRSLSYNYAGAVSVEETRVYDYASAQSHTLALAYSYDNAERIACSRIILAG